MRLPQVGCDYSSTTIARIPVTLGVDNHRNIGLFAGGDNRTYQVLGKHALGVVRKHAGMQIGQTLLYPAKNMFFGLARDRMGFLAVGPQKLLTVGYDTCFGDSRSILARV